MAARIVMRGLAWLVGAFVAVNIVALLSPWHVLVRSVVEHSLLDHDLLLPVPPDWPPERASEIRSERVCVYWGGGAHLWPTFMPVAGRCPLFREKQGTARLPSLA